jgi:hypothetical protein
LRFSLARGGTAAGAHVHAQTLAKSASDEFASKPCSAVIASDGAAVFQVSSKPAMLATINTAPAMTIPVAERFAERKSDA